MRLLRVVQYGMAERRDQCTTKQLEDVDRAVTELRNKGYCPLPCVYMINDFIHNDVIHSTALANFSATTDDVYNNLIRSHDPSRSHDRANTDFLAVEATVSNVSSYMASWCSYHGNNIRLGMLLVI